MAIFGLYFLVFSVWVVLCSYVVHGGAGPDVAMEKGIENMRKTISAKLFHIKQRTLSNEDELWLANAYKNLGLMIQSKGIKQHMGGDRLLREALGHYETALNYDQERTVAINVQVLYLRGILLKMMGFGDDAIESYEKALLYSLSELDQSSIHFHLADCLQMMGRVQEAKENFEISLRLRPCRTDRYYQYVNNCKDVGISQTDWEELFELIRSRLEACEKGNTGPVLLDGSMG